MSRKHFFRFFFECIIQDELKKQNLISTVLGSNDVKTGMKSAVKALGANNPFTINTAGEVAATVAVQGGTMIALSNKINSYFRILICVFIIVFKYLQLCVF